MEYNGSHFGSQASQKLPTTRRIWTQREERCLIEAFHDIVAQGWKADNGFKHGFLIQLQNKLRISLPGTDLTTVNINSKYGSWKKTFKDVHDTLKNSGFNWNCVTFKVTAGSDATWDEWCLAHHDLAYVRNKYEPLPLVVFAAIYVELTPLGLFHAGNEEMYDHLATIFGPDSARLGRWEPDHPNPPFQIPTMQEAISEYANNEDKMKIERESFGTIIPRSIHSGDGLFLVDSSAPVLCFCMGIHLLSSEERHQLALINLRALKPNDFWISDE